VVADVTKRRLQRIAAGFNRKARKFHVQGVVSWEMLAALGDRCTYCGVGLSLEHGTWDHQVAFDKGGTNWITNIVRCCTGCQRRKFTKTPEEYAAHKDLMVKCARPDCDVMFKPRFAERQRGMAKFHSYACAGMAKGKGW
jgi:hypothetical protein